MTAVMKIAAASSPIRTTHGATAQAKLRPLETNESECFSQTVPRHISGESKIRRFLIVAAGLLGVLAATGTAPASSMTTLRTFKAVCIARDGYFAIVGHRAVCQLPSGRILTMSQGDDSYDYGRTAVPSLSFRFGDHHDRHRDCALGREHMLTMSGDCRDRTPIESKPIGMSKPTMKGLYRH
jgi:hypothetical protein